MKRLFAPLHLWDRISFHSSSIFISSKLLSIPISSILLPSITAIKCNYFTIKKRRIVALFRAVSLSWQHTPINIIQYIRTLKKTGNLFHFYFHINVIIGNWRWNIGWMVLFTWFKTFPQKLCFRWISKRNTRIFILPIYHLLQQGS